MNWQLLNRCAQIEANDGVFQDGFITDFEAPITGAGSTGCDDLGAMKIDLTQDIDGISFIGNKYALNFQASGSYPLDLTFSNNSDESGNTPVDLINCTPNAVIYQQQGVSAPSTGAGSNPAGGSIEVQAVVTLTITGFVDNSELYARDATDLTTNIVERFNEESAVGNYEYTYNASENVGAEIDLFIMKNQTSATDTGYQWLSFRDFPLPQSDNQLFVTQIRERNANLF